MGLRRESFFPIGTLMEGRYEIVPHRPADDPDNVYDVIGRGGMGVVYRALDQKMGREVALKTIIKALAEKAQEAGASPRGKPLDPQRFLERFFREAKTVASLEHPNIVAAHDFGQHEDCCFIVMPFNPRAFSVASGIEKHRRTNNHFALADVQRIFLDVYSALAYVHERDIIHRDIKPSNILAVPGCEGPRGQLLDFGIARVPNSELTNDQEMLGSSGYFSPEAIRIWMGASKEKIDHRVDLWASAVSMYETLVLTRPFHASDDMALYRVIMEQEPLRPAQLREDIEQGCGFDYFLMRALSKDPALRFRTAIEAHEALSSVEKLRAGTASRARKPPPVPLDDDLAADPAVLESVMPALQLRPVQDDGGGSALFNLPELPSLSRGVGEEDNPPAPSESSATKKEKRAAQALDDVPAHEPTSLHALHEKPERLPRRVKWALGLSGAVVCLTVLVLLGSAASRHKHPTPTTVLRPEDAEEQNKPVTYEELLDSEREHRRETLVEGYRRAAVPIVKPQKPSATNEASSGPTPNGNPTADGAKDKAGGAMTAAVASTASPKRRAQRHAATARHPNGAEASVMNVSATMAMPTTAGSSESAVEKPRVVLERYNLQSNNAETASGSASGTAATNSAKALAAASKTPLVAPATLCDARLDLPITSESPSALAMATVVGACGALPVGARIEGRPRYGASNKVERIEVTFTRLLLPDNSSRPILAHAYSANAQPGLVGRAIRRNREIEAEAGDTGLDVVQEITDALPLRRTSDRIVRNQRQDMQALRNGAMTVQLPQAFGFKVLFVDVR